MSRLYEKYTDEKFEDAQALQDFFRSGKRLKYDYVIVGGILYTMHEYDLHGQYITWANKKHFKVLEVRTTDRYHKGFLDATVDIYEPSYLRTDITYAE